MTTRDQHTDAYANQAAQGQPQYATDNQNYVPEDQVAPMQHDTTGTHGAGPSTTPMDPQAAGLAQQHEQRADMQQHGQRTDHETDADGRLFADDELAGLRARWDAVQAGFVDDPKDCVQKADGLVADLVQQLTTGFGQARSRLEEQWGRGEQASTEDLRVALKRYRSFFERLLSV
ncbi:hypothetical protein [Mycolicibacterium psychrotolerans]|uniref:Uncharacterized protein n=1 Tax=Mycolicibacterium psychrotolerans TaxID=216929 RepID=A0A7I7M393_9MYCO|nr:hypothetical protein [Mycolicibacterium psychrotolerans]BBX66624.1 hypothetical protein MPSYJ_00850 [Mycolicibacterium psychrotolerans]